MRRLVAFLITIAMTTTGCATYEGARTARNAGIVMGIAGLAALGAGIALSQQNDGGCPSGGGGNARNTPAVWQSNGLTVMPCLPAAPNPGMTSAARVSSVNLPWSMARRTNAAVKDLESDISK